MIESITISSTATFGAVPETLNDLTQLNYLFGANGTGKTTVSRIIADETKLSACKVTWKGGTKLQSMVYNRDFVERNFNQSAELKGVFTLGEKQVDTLAKIETAKNEFDTLTKKIENLSAVLQGTDDKRGKKGELTVLEDGFKDKCWAQKQKHDVRFQGSFEGYRNSTEKFKNKVLQEMTSNKAKLLPLLELEKKAESVFNQTSTKETFILGIDTARLLSHESNPILNKRVIGQEDVDIAAMINKLGNSDWVREGRPFYNMNDGVCPFCQQSSTEAFAKSLNEYFDEVFATDSKSIDDLVTNYANDAAQCQQQVAIIIASPSKFIDVEMLRIEKELLDTKIMLNIQLLAEKKKEPSKVVALESLNSVFTKIKSLIDYANDQIKEHNKIIENLAIERTTLTAQVWKFVLEELKIELNTFKEEKDNLEKAIAAMTEKIKKLTEEKRNKLNEIQQLEKLTTSIQPTIDEINALLFSFGFQGFKLAKAASGTSYKLVRPDGSDAKATLSEGEKTFITFLYFYHLLKGSDSASGITTNRIVVFDDPVSSLDSDILFIVSILIKGLIDEMEAGTSYIKQIFVLTHNVYFHKEVTFNPNRRNNKAMHGKETFWIIRKSSLVSKIEKYNHNPIKTSYELLWDEVRRSDRSNLTIQNTLRRILENYFKIIGGINIDNIYAMFEGRDKLICKSLFSWVNDGSHSAHDDIYVSIDSSMIETYLTVFRDIFRKFNQLEHYKMMMGDAYVEEPANSSQ